jgi:pimeloyl-CoA synthetase
MNIKNKLITAMVFTAEDTNGLIIHLNGFDDPNHANNFLKKLMKNSGIEYQSIKDLYDLPTIH